MPGSSRAGSNLYMISEMVGIMVRLLQPNRKLIICALAILADSIHQVPVPL